MISLRALRPANLKMVMVSYTLQVGAVGTGWCHWYRWELFVLVQLGAVGTGRSRWYRWELFELVQVGAVGTGGSRWCR